jgi:choline dehydrogenase-like flavoprotein
VWIGDGSAFPTSSGTNPMITIMALARRTAGAIAATAPDRAAVGATVK